MKKNNLFKSKNFIIIDTSYVIWSYDDHFIGNDFFDQNDDPNRNHTQNLDHNHNHIRES